MSAEHLTYEPRASQMPCHLIIDCAHVLGALHPTPRPELRRCTMHASLRSLMRHAVRLHHYQASTFATSSPLCLGGRCEAALGEASAADARHPAEALRLRLGARVLHQVSRLLRVPARARHEAVHARWTRRD